MPAIVLRRRDAKFLFERLLQRADIPVFAKDQRNYHPVVARPYLAIGAVVALKGRGLSILKYREHPRSVK